MLSNPNFYNTDRCAGIIINYHYYIKNDTFFYLIIKFVFKKDTMYWSSEEYRFYILYIKEWMICLKTYISKNNNINSAHNNNEIRVEKQRRRSEPWGRRLQFDEKSGVKLELKKRKD